MESTASPFDRYSLRSHVEAACGRYVAVVLALPSRTNRIALGELCERRTYLTWVEAALACATMRVDTKRRLEGGR